MFLLILKMSDTYRKDEAFIVVGMLITGLKFHLISILVFPFTDKLKINQETWTDFLKIF